jgi:DNA-binding Lrp family transcriptional regulator
MDDTDRKLLNMIQEDFPVEPEPFRILGVRIGISEKEVLERIAALKEKGVIRRIGAVFQPAKLGYASTLCAAVVPADRIEFFADIVNGYPGVTHNYERDHEYNIWFTLIAPSEPELEKTLEEISRRTGTEILSLRAVQTFKIDARFEV